MGTAEAKKRGRPKKVIEEKTEETPKEAEASTELSKNNFYKDILARVGKKEEKGTFHTLGISNNVGLKISWSKRGIGYLNSTLCNVTNCKDLNYTHGYSLDTNIYKNDFFIATMFHNKTRNTSSSKEVKGPYYEILSKDGNAQRIWLALKAQIYLHDPILGGTFVTAKVKGTTPKEIFAEALFTTLLFADYAKFPMNNKSYLNGNPIESILYIVSIYIVKEIILK